MVDLDVIPVFDSAVIAELSEMKFDREDKLSLAGDPRVTDALWLLPIIQERGVSLLMLLGIGVTKGTGEPSHRDNDGATARAGPPVTAALRRSGVKGTELKEAASPRLDFGQAGVAHALSDWLKPS